MAKITNNTRRGITLPTLHVIPAMGFNDKLSNETIRCADNWPNLTGRILTGDVSVEFDEEDEDVNPPVPEFVSVRSIYDEPVYDKPLLLESKSEVDSVDV